MEQDISHATANHYPSYLLAYRTLFNVRQGTLRYLNRNALSGLVACVFESLWRRLGWHFFGMERGRSLAGLVGYLVDKVAIAGEAGKWNSCSKSKQEVSFVGVDIAVNP